MPITLKARTTETEARDASRDRTLLVGIRSYEKMKSPPLASRVIIIDARLPPTTCNRLSAREWCVGGLQFGIELAGDDAVIWDAQGQGDPRPGA